MILSKEQVHRYLSPTPSSVKLRLPYGQQEKNKEMKLRI